ncbi:MAG TPA: DUF2066 domain-containing protein [Porticoccaceae bacterium]|nr:DUF2066 domain-containing protein [Gammaproteobacteria bacterium]HIL59506.1 DUF2066 domain-containing protein [Porticoccaceae bacterium]
MLKGSICSIIGAMNFSKTFQARISIPWLVIACLVTPVSYGLQVTDLYVHQVAVSNESDSERSRAFGEALSAVIIKVTGERRWLLHPTIERALDNAQDYVKAISYISEAIELVQEASAAPQQNRDSRNTQDNAGGALVNTPNLLQEVSEQRYITVNFAAELIDQLLTDADIPVWDSNRPSVLVWMALQTESGERRLLTADNQPEIIRYMQDFALERGLPIIFPVLDFEDRQSLNEDQLWNLEESAIELASIRYGADSILSGRLHFTAGGELVGLWKFIFQDEADVFDGFDQDLQGYLYEPLDRVTNKLSSYFAIVPEESTEQFVRLRIEGINNLTAYSALLSYVSNLGLVQSVAAAELDGERLELELGLVGDVVQLYELIALDRDLLPIESSLSRGDSLLHYRWTR